jgi:hypothetical protein
VPRDGQSSGEVGRFLGTIAGGTMLAGEQAMIANQQIFMTLVGGRRETSRIYVASKCIIERYRRHVGWRHSHLSKRQQKTRSDIQTNLARKPPATTFAASVC